MSVLLGHIIYLIFGSDTSRVKREMISSIRSLIKTIDEQRSEEIRITIYSDDELILPSDILIMVWKIIKLDKEQIKYWIGECNGFKFVLKPRILEHFFSSFAGVAMLIDTDTFFRRDPVGLFEKIKDGKAVFHLKEHHITLRPQILNYLTTVMSRDLELVDFPMWNAGVIGMNSLHRSALNEVIEIIKNISNDNLWPVDEMQVIEQMAFSKVLHRTTKIISADHYVVHYWFLKPFVAVLEACFDPNYIPDSNDVFAININNQKIKQKELLSLLFELMSQVYPVLPNYVFDALPARTWIGKWLRKYYPVNSIITDK